MSDKINDIQYDGYVVGDPIRVSCSLGVKEGYILEFCENRIRLRPVSAICKPISIYESSIEGWESAENLIDGYTASTEEALEESDALVEDEEMPAEENVENTEDDSTEPVEDTNIQPNFGPAVIPPKVKVLGRIDLAEDESKFRKITQPTAARPDSALPKYIANLVGNFDRKANDSMVMATGRISRFGNLGYGFILDNETQENIWFSEADVCDNSIYNSSRLDGMAVIYSKRINSKGVVARGVCRPRVISELLALADFLESEKNSTERARYILEIILAQYPDNEDAKTLFYDITGLEATPENYGSASTTKVLPDIEPPAILKNEGYSSELPILDQIKEAERSVSSMGNEEYQKAIGELMDYAVKVDNRGAVYYLSTKVLKNSKGEDFEKWKNFAVDYFASKGQPKQSEYFRRIFKPAPAPVSDASSIDEVEPVA